MLHAKFHINFWKILELNTHYFFTFFSEYHFSCDVSHFMCFKINIYTDYWYMTNEGKSIRESTFSMAWLIIFKRAIWLQELRTNRLHAVKAVNMAALPYIDSRSLMYLI